MAYKSRTPGFNNLKTNTTITPHGLSTMLGCVGITYRTNEETKTKKDRVMICIMSHS